MLSRDNRYSFREGVPERRGDSPFFVVRYRPNGYKTSRFAIVISKKIDKRAVVRNKIKRRISHILAHLLDEYRIHIDAVVYVRKPILTADNNQLLHSFQQILIKEGIINRI